MRDYFLSRALELTDKPITCCDYYISSFGLRDYIIFLSKFSFKRIGNEANKLIDINSLMVKRDFFLENLQNFKDLTEEKNSELINEDNTAFISIPLVSIRKLRKIEYEKMKKAFEFRFQNDLFFLYYRNKLLFSSYLYKLLLKSFLGNLFILRYLFELKKDRASIDKINVNSVYFKDSPIEKFITKNNQ